MALALEQHAPTSPGRPLLAGSLRESTRIELEREVPVITPVPTRSRQLADTVQWSAVFVLLAGAAWVLLLPLTRGWSDAGVGLAAATGWIVPAWLMWIGNELGLWPTDPSTETGIVPEAVPAAESPVETGADEAAPATTEESE